MIEIKMTTDDINKASVLAERLGIRSNSILQGQGNKVGFVGKIAIAKLLGVEFNNTPDHDMILGDGTRITVKAKQSKFEPRPDYECSIAAASPIQGCDWYVFVRVKDDLSVVWVAGFLPKADYFAKAKLLKKGERQGDNNFEVRADCYNVSISDLRPLSVPSNSKIDSQEWLRR